MCKWLNEWIDFLFPEPVETAVAPDGRERAPYDWNAPLPKPPEFYLRPELIPTKEPDDTPLLADAYVRAGGGG